VKGREDLIVPGVALVVEQRSQFERERMAGLSAAATLST